MYNSFSSIFLAAKKKKKILQVISVAYLKLKINNKLNSYDNINSFKKRI